MPNILTTAFTMVQTICNGCNRYFKCSCKLSNHFQFETVGKTIHLNLNQQYQAIPDLKTQVDKNEKKMAVTPPEEINTKQGDINQAINNSCLTNVNIDVEESSIDTAPFASKPTEEDEPI